MGSTDGAQRNVKNAKFGWPRDGQRPVKRREGKKIKSKYENSRNR